MKKTADAKAEVKLPVQTNEIDLILKAHLTTSQPNESEELKPITIWVPKSEHADYESLQTKTKRKFGKTMKKIFSLSIERAKLAV